MRAAQRQKLVCAPLSRLGGGLDLLRVRARARVGVGVRVRVRARVQVRVRARAGDRVTPRAREGASTLSPSWS